MATCVYIDAFGTVRNSSDPVEDCNTFILVNPAEYQAYELTSLWQIQDAADVLYLYSWGMGAILMPWALAYAIRAAKKAIRMA